MLVVAGPEFLGYRDQARVDGAGRVLMPRSPLPMREALERWKRENYVYDEQYRMADQHELTNALARIGKKMPSHEFVEKIKRINPFIWVEESNNYDDPSITDDKEKHNGMNWYTMRDKKKVCLMAAFKRGWVPEWTIVHVDDRDLPIDKTPGWREVILNLIRSKALTFKQIAPVFGNPATDAAWRWSQQTQRFR